MLISAISYRREKVIKADEFIDVLQRSTLAERRPINDPGRIKAMLRNANLFVTARKDGKLVGVARSLTDYGFCTYMSDLAVDREYQKWVLAYALSAKPRFIHLRQS